MPTVWAALKKSLNCKSGDSCGVIERDESQGGVIGGKKSSSSSAAAAAALRRSGCSRSIANLRDVIHNQYGGSRRQEVAAAAGDGGECGSPRSIGSNDVLNPVTHDVLLAAGPDAKCELRISTPGRGAWAGAGGGVLFPHSPLLLRCSTTPVSTRKSPSAMSPLRRAGTVADDDEADAEAPSPAPARASCEVGVRCHRCGDRFANHDALESHHLSRHAVTELVEGDSSRKVVEIICKAGWAKTENALGRVERVVKVHNAERSVARFEEFRETVKGKAARLPKKHPRCLADGNELLRFHATTLACSLGAGDSSALCTSGKCNVCRIIRHGFSTTREVKDGVGVFTTSTSKRALECIQETFDGGEAEAANAGVRKALLVCRVVAGRIHRPLENLQEVAAQPGFDSVAGKVGAYASIEELYLLNPRALLPCFVVICKP
uniref:C2H2-type domain-containing protein n=1 Tax=Oryza punctata TaxID=4537 RepID=A0A0E0LET1_ORYPU